MLSEQDPQLLGFYCCTGITQVGNNGYGTAWLSQRRILASDGVDNAERAYA